MMRVTLDHNALIDLQNGTGDIASLQRLRGMHSEGIIRVCIPAIQASERQRDGTILDDYYKFQSFAESSGLRDYEELIPMLYLDVCYLDHAMLTEPAMEDLEARVHQVLFPNVEFSYEKYAAKEGIPSEPPFDRGWLNPKCDVQAIWSHI